MHRLVIALVVLLVAGFVASAIPVPMPVFFAPIWFGVATTALWGYGSIATRALPALRLGFGLRTAWGAALALSCGSVLLAIGVLNRWALLGLVGLGVVLAAVDAVRRRKTARGGVRARWRVSRQHPRTALVFALVLAVLGFFVLGSLVDRHTHPYDDDIAYVSFVHRLWDSGDLVEPFSFRRIAAYGGQTVFVAMFALRTTVKQVQLFDHGFALAILVALLYERRGAARPVPPLYRHALAFFVVLLPDISINTASHYSGALFVLALYMALARANRTPLTPLQRALFVAPLAVAVVSLRQNFLPIPAIMLVGDAVLRLRRTAREDRGVAVKAELLVLAVVVALWLPWAIASYRAVGTFLYPLTHGNFNPALALTGAPRGFFIQVRTQLWIFLASEPLRLLPAFMLPGLACGDRALGRTRSLSTAAFVASFVLLVTGFAQADPPNLSRYLFPLALPLAVAVLQDVSAPAVGARVSRIAMAAWAVVVVQAYDARATFFPRVTRAANDAHEVFGYGLSANVTTPEQSLYTKLQESVPAGKRMAVVLDEPYYLDYRRNPILNVDMPGYLSPAPGLPYFRGPGELLAYLRGLGVDYLAFVEDDFSHVQYRREDWVRRSYGEMDVWRLFGAYVLDLQESLRALSLRGKPLFHEQGMVVLDLAAISGSDSTPPKHYTADEERTARDTFLKSLAEREGTQEAYGLTSREDVRFEEGFSPLEFDPPGDVRKHAFRWVGQKAHVRLKSHGDKPSHLLIGGWSDQKNLMTHATLRVTINGHILASNVATTDGGIGADLTVDASTLEGREWSDLYLEVTTLYYDWEPKNYRAILISKLTWE